MIPCKNRVFSSTTILTQIANSFIETRFTLTIERYDAYGVYVNKNVCML